jgi:hypothetical protein
MVSLLEVQHVKYSTIIRQIVARQKGIHKQAKNQLNSVSAKLRVKCRTKKYMWYCTLTPKKKMLKQPAKTFSRVQQSLLIVYFFPEDM